MTEARSEKYAPFTVNINTADLDERIEKLTQLDYQLGNKIDQLQKMSFLDSDQNSGEMKIYTTEELAQKLGRGKAFVSKLFKYGLLHGMKMGPAHLFSDEDLREFWMDYRDFDLSTDQHMKLAKQLVDKRKKERKPL